MNDSQSAKLIMSSILIGAGAISYAVSAPRSDGIALAIGPVLLVVGVVMLIVQWRTDRQRGGRTS